MIRSGVKAKVTCIDPRKLDRSFAGRDLDAAFIGALPRSVDPWGENGEFRAFVFAPRFPVDALHAVGQSHASRALARGNGHFEWVAFRLIRGVFTLGFGISAWRLHACILRILAHTYLLLGHAAPAASLAGTEGTRLTPRVPRTQSEQYCS